MQCNVAVISGTGVGRRLEALGGRAVHVPTSEGQMAGVFMEQGAHQVLVLQRHGSGHRTPPHRVNYKAMALGLRHLGIRYCLSTAAVGSLRLEWGPGTLIACSDFIDLTGRFPTLFEREVIHTDFTEPFSSKSRQAILNCAESIGLAVCPEGVYVGGNGPRYETPAEIRMMQKLGGDMVGMTATSEAILMREAGIQYACLAVVTNLAAGLGNAELTHGEVVDVMECNADSIVSLLLAAAERLNRGD